MSVICTRALLYNKFKINWRHQITISRFQTFITRKYEAQITKYWNIPLFTSYVIDFQYKIKCNSCTLYLEEILLKYHYIWSLHHLYWVCEATCSKNWLSIKLCFINLDLSSPGSSLLAIFKSGRSREKSLEQALHGHVTPWILENETQE